MKDLILVGKDIKKGKEQAKVVSSNYQSNFPYVKRARHRVTQINPFWLEFNIEKPKAAVYITIILCIFYSPDWGGEGVYPNGKIFIDGEDITYFVCSYDTIGTYSPDIKKMWKDIDISTYCNNTGNHVVEFIASSGDFGPGIIDIKIEVV
jgi:hypothetical protein